MLSFTTLAVTPAEAEAYADSRGLTWTGDEPELRRGQDYVAGMYNGRWTVQFTDATAPDAVKYAIVEAAIAEITTPGLLSKARKVISEVGAGSARVKFAVSESSSDMLVDPIPRVELLLIGLIRIGMFWPAIAVV